jgi:hypothetical protein
VSLAVKRVEEQLDIRIFDRTGPSITLTQKGERVARGFDRVIEILAGIKSERGETDALRIGLSPLLSGADVAKLLGGHFKTRAVSFGVEFLDSLEIASRSDFDVKIMLPGLRRRSAVSINFPTYWIGENNGVFVRSLQETAVWDRAMHVLVDNRITVSKVIEVNDCGYAYHLAASGVGFTPCVMTKDNSFQNNVLPALPSLPPIRLEIFADPDVAELLRSSLGSTQAGAAPELAMAR